MIGVSKMMNNVALKVAVSAIAIGMTMVACTPATDASRPNSASSRSPKRDQQAAAFAAKAKVALQKGSISEAVTHAERAVEFSPSDVGYRMLLADLYLKNGRFQSAETTFTDVLRLDPGNSRAAMSAALTRIALGRSGEAIAELDELSRTAPPADVGLAYALAGDPRRAIEMLEPAARAPEATGRVRQNLALAYALAGDWEKAKVVAAQDVSPAELGNRLQHWARLAQPTEPWSQVAALLGVTPVTDAGQPIRLALAQPETAGTALAAAEAAPSPEREPVRVAQGGPEEAVPAESGLSDVAAWVSSTSDPVTEETKPLYAEAVETLVKPQPTVIRPSAPAIESPAERFDSAPRSAPARARGIGTGRFAVQLGAFSTPKAVERAWASAYKRYGFASETPLSTTVRNGSRVLHRLSVAGFTSHGDASQVCRSVKAKGGVCFVRAVAGDAPVQWASRYTVGRRG
jgi:Flp pilus assembly protein TadD